MDPKKQALLEKRKKYDPRAAIKKSKKIIVVETASTIEQAPRENAESVHSAADKTIPVSTIETDDAEDAQKDPNVPARPFLKRNHSKAVKLDKSQKQAKPQGKSKIDCWQKEGTPNTITIIGGKQLGGKKQNRQSLLKKTQQPKEPVQSSPNRPGNPPPLKNSFKQISA